MSIDWSKAPEGATHWGPEQTSGTSSYVECWFKIEDGADKFYCCADMVEDGWRRYKGHMPEERKLALVERRAAWNGAGLPPVGTVCEGSMPAWGEYRKNWIKCRVIAHEKGSAVVIKGTTVLAWCDTFRPIRTQEQIEAEEREKAIELMMCAYAQGGFEALYDAGYRKIEGVK